MMAADDKLAPFPIEFAKRPSRFQLEDFDTLKPGALTWRVKGLWPAVGVCFVGGPSMSGKSFWTLDALARVCRGEDVLGRKAMPAGVLYIAAEGAHGVKNRISGLRSRIGPLGGVFKFIGQAPDLRDTEDVADLRAVIEEAAAEMEAAGQRLGVVAVDTLSASIPGADENSAQDMSPVLHALQTLAADLGVLVVVVAHTGKDETRGLRGWSGLLANADGLVMLESPEGDIRQGAVVKVKDGVSGDRFGFMLESLTIGIDDDGDEITTCVVAPADAPERAKAGRKATVADHNARLLKAAFNRIFADKAQRLAFPSAAGAKGVHESDLRTEAFQVGLGPAEPDYGGMSDPDRKKARADWTRHRAKSFDRARDELLANHGFRYENQWLWDASANKGESL